MTFLEIAVLLLALALILSAAGVAVSSTVFLIFGIVAAALVVLPLLQRGRSL